MTAPLILVGRPEDKVILFSATQIKNHKKQIYTFCDS